MISRSLIIQAFHQNGKKIPAAAVDERVATIVKEQYGGDWDAFQNTLSERGVSLSTYRSEIIGNMIVGSMRNQNAGTSREDWIASLRKKARVKIYLP